MKLQRLIEATVSPYLMIGVVCSLSIVACGGGSSAGSSAGSSMLSQAPTTSLTDTALVASNTGLVATVTTIDANLSNPWGLVTAPGLPFWVADNNSNLATLRSEERRVGKECSS